jgi:3'5'-cyclic nucleotide phosphodiesterase
MQSNEINFCEKIRLRRLTKTSLIDSFKEAQSLLHIPKNSFDSRLLNLIAITNEMLAVVEDYGHQRELEGNEPAYHNRQHFADACLSLAIFLTKTENFSDQQKQLLLLTILCHDYGHRGISQKLDDQSHEEETVALLKDTPLNKLSESDFELLSELIIGTTPHNLKAVNARYLKNPEHPTYFMQSLINDSDIAASFIDSLTPSLTKAILIESGNSNPTDQEVGSGIDFFKQNFQITTDIAKYFLS